jgi:hypothetical protein
MVEQCWNDPLVGVLLDEVAGIRSPCHRGMGERGQPQLVQDRGREGGVLHAPGDADGLVPEVAFEPVLQLAPEVRDGIARAGGNLPKEDQYPGTARYGRVRREVRPLDLGVSRSRCVTPNLNKKKRRTRSSRLTRSGPVPRLRNSLIASGSWISRAAGGQWC